MGNRMFGNNMELLWFVNLIYGPSDHKVGSLWLGFIWNNRHKRRDLRGDRNVRVCLCKRIGREG
jgi:hypothetical protein